MSEWISVEDRLPEAGQRVDIWVDGKRLANWYLDSYSPSDSTKHWYSGKMNIFDCESMPIRGKDFWMPLPEPPK